MYKRILIAIDASELSHRGVFQGLELAKATGAKVDIVTVSEPWAMGMYDAMGWSVGYEASPEYRKEREAAAEKILRPALELAAAANIKATSRHVLDRFAAEGIVQTAKECNSDLIIMTSHGRRGMQRMLLGSQTVEVLTHSSIPVLVIR
ncbi:universal stress protein [Xanthomonas oryzae pv. oryzicola]|uniref:Universal stress protein n=1 Tax=Xanthomonas oryzae pv. oryzicola (strain BLS256) TaxID=383407 RepID=G7TLK4_XANOB|nr:universal stress protein [Xanthomonas oryzae]AEQ94631.1 universal stress protein family protein [Xanthomonas oryzae pv. oryzicola BLS256]AJQ89460.1 universal stress protein UspA [Xanthomonas oryzae pv. oryzicola]AKK62636.1 universal stress protein UspA [Xanthomonas oryzae pv. oryzicola]AKN94840.1 universal stress protein UspA [Xanthomonas oryzae pv. oryzicola]AKN98565.1 universal stress protein UspA [Xanthomonas oryzae pv. oryzicola]